MYARLNSTLMAAINIRGGWQNCNRYAASEEKKTTPAGAHIKINQTDVQIMDRKQCTKRTRADGVSFA